MGSDREPRGTDDKQPAGPPKAPRSLREAIESQSQQVNLSRLAQKKKVARVVSLSTLERIMTEAVENVLLQGPADPLLDRESLRKQTQDEFQRLLQMHQQAVQEKNEADEAREALEKQVSALKTELQLQVKKFEEEKARISPHVSLSQDSLVEMEDRVRALFRELVDEKTVANAGGHAAVLESQFRSIFDSILSHERGLALAQHKEAHDQELARLGLRIKKLNTALKTSEDALTRLVEQKEIDPGVASIYRSVQGIAPDAVNVERKQELLRVVFVNNLRLRGRDVTSEDLDGVQEEHLLRIPPGDGGEEKDRDPPEPGTDSISFRKPVTPQTDETAF